MGKKRFNAKARSTAERIIDNTEIEKIKIDLPSSEYGGYDESNALVLPSNKRQNKLKKDDKATTISRILSKKQRKHLETIVEKKKKKQNRASILQALSEVQLPADELKKYTSISKVQTIGVKNLQKVDKEIQLIQHDIKIEEIARISSIAGKSKRKRLALLAGYTGSDDEDDVQNSKKKKDYNIIGLNDDSSSSDAESVAHDKNDTESENNKNFKKDDWVEEEINIQNSEKRNFNSEVLTKEITTNGLKTETFQKKKDKKIIVEEKPKLPVQPTVYVHVYRNPAVQIARLKLPILAEEQQIMETINENSIIIIAGETGSGKTTQLPQFLYEAGYAEKKLIGITEPRRVAAISMSKRVAYEMNLNEKIVSYLIRFEGNASESTKIKFMTDGVLLKETETDFLLSKYSVIILDEAHERSVYTDILIGLLSRIVPLRNKKGNPLKLIVMSATLRIEDFTNNERLFKIPPPILKVEARQFPVTIHFQRRTSHDYVREAYRKIMKIHSQLPDGGILVFLTGQLEVNRVVKKLRKAFPLLQKEKKIKKISKETELEEEFNDDEFDIKKAIKNVKKSKKKLAKQITNLPQINLDNYKLPSDDTEADLLENDNEADENISDIEDDEEDEAISSKQPIWALPLYSLLSSEKQAKVFEPVPENCRLCVVSTNVAETSLTIPNIKYVVDSGRQKTRLYDKLTGVSSFVITFTSKAAADQRAGRAGRTSPGHCYRLYSSAIYNDEFCDFAVPDIQKKPVDDLMLQMKCMGIDKVINFPFPSPPDLTQLQTAEKRLLLLGALEETKTTKNDTITKVTSLGKAISNFPVLPRFGKMLALSHQKKLLPYTVCMAAALSVQEVLIEVTLNEESNANTKWQQKRRVWAGTGNSLLLGDPMVLLRAVGASEYAGSHGKLDQFCSENGLRSKAITEIRKLRIQLTNEINLSLSSVNLFVDPKMDPPTDLQAKYLRQILLAGMGDQVARKLPLDDITDKDERRKLKYAYNCIEMEEPVFMHSSSVLKKNLPEWIIYQEVYELQNGDSKKMFLRGCTAIEPEWLLLYCPILCNILAIKDTPAPKYNNLDGKIYCYVDASYGKAGWPLPLTEIEMPLDEKACKYFGMFILNGDVFPKLLEYKNKLKATPSSLIKSWSNLNEYVVNFTKQLLIKDINSKHKLLNIWKSDPTFLRSQYCDLLYGIDESRLSLNWPPTEPDDII